MQKYIEFEQLLLGPDSVYGLLHHPENHRVTITHADNREVTYDVVGLNTHDDAVLGGIYTSHDNGEKKLNICFAGTQNTQTVVADLDTLAPGYNAHKESRVNILTQLYTLLIIDHNPTDTLRISVGGHSLGGSLSQYTATDLVELLALLANSNAGDFSYDSWKCDPGTETTALIHMVLETPPKIKQALLNSIKSLDIVLFNSPGIPDITRRRMDHFVEKLKDSSSINIALYAKLCDGDIVQQAGPSHLFAQDTSASRKIELNVLKIQSARVKFYKSLASGLELKTLRDLILSKPELQAHFMSISHANPLMILGGYLITQTIQQLLKTSSAVISHTELFGDFSPASFLDKGAEIEILTYTPGESAKYLEKIFCELSNKWINSDGLAASVQQLIPDGLNVGFISEMILWTSHTLAKSIEAYGQEQLPKKIYPKSIKTAENHSQFVQEFYRQLREKQFPEIAAEIAEAVKKQQQLDAEVEDEDEVFYDAVGTEPSTEPVGMYFLMKMKQEKPSTKLPLLSAPEQHSSSFFPDSVHTTVSNSNRIK